MSPGKRDASSSMWRSILALDMAGLVRVGPAPIIASTYLG